MVTQSRNLRLHLKGDSLRDNHAHTIFWALVRDNYYDRKQFEFMTLTKPNASKDFVFLTLIFDDARGDVLKSSLTYHHEKLRVSIPRNKEATAPSELRIGTTLVANNLPQKNTQTAIVIALKRLEMVT